MIEFLASHRHVLAFLVDLARATFWLVVLTAVFTPLEHFFSVRPVKVFHKGWRTNLAWYFIGSFVPIFLLGLPSAVIAMAIHAILPASVTGAATALPLWA